MAYVQNYMVVDGVLKDLVEDLANYIDQIDPPAEESASFYSFISERLVEDGEEATPQQEEIFKAVAERSAVLSQAPEREFEAQYNLVLHILTFSSDLTTILPIVLKNLSNPPTYKNGPILSLAVLTNMFNILPVSSPLRYQVFLAILDSAAATNNIGLVVSQIKHLPERLKEWNVSEDDTRDLFVKISTLLTSSHDDLTAYKYLLSAVVSAESSTFPLTSKLVQTAIVLDSVYDFDELFALEPVQNLKLSEAVLFHLLETVATGDYAAFKDFQNKNSEFLTDNKIDPVKLEHKVRVLALAKVASHATQRTIPYTVFANAIDVPVEDVEMWVIDTIRAGLIEGRLSQITQSFALHGATPIGKFDADDWKAVSNKLEGWKSGLKDILEVLKTARENAAKDELAAAKLRQNAAATRN